MKIIQKLALVLFTLIICQYQLAATSPTHFTKNLIDTIPQVEPEYNGNRIQVKSIKVIKKKGKSYKIEYKLVNNGRNKIKLGKSKLIPNDLIIQFDASLKENDLEDAKYSIIENIKKQSISIRPGQLIMGNKLKFTYRPIPPSDRMANESEKSNQEKKVVDQIIVKDDNPKTNFDEAVKEIVEEVPLPDSELENPRTLSQSSSSRELIENQVITLDETILVNENNPTENIEVKETESIVEISPKEKSETDVISINKNEEEIDSDISKEENPEDENSNEKLCADLIIEDAEIVKKNKRYVLVKYTIKNVGNLPIPLHGKTKKETDNIAIQSHFTRSHNLTRGSIPVDFSFIKKGNRDVKGMLAPGESISKKMKIETSKMTKFTPVLALTLNPSAANFECSRLNNIFFIDVSEKAPKSVPKKPIQQETFEKITTIEN